MKRYERIDKHALMDAINASLNFSEVCRLFGKQPVGGNITNIKHLAKKWEIDTTHMTGQAHNRGKPSPRKKSVDQRLVLGKSTDRRTPAHILRNALLAIGTPYRCNVCHITEWNGKPVVFEVDHIDSKYWNNRKENLQFICPTCHSQETLSRGRLV